MSGKLERFARDLAAKAAKLELPRQVEDVFGRYRDDPMGFCRDVLGVESATRRSDGEAYQFAVLESLVSEPRVAVRSGHGVGKSAIDAWALLWWLVTRPYSRVVVLAPEFSRQVKAILFSEARKWARRSKLELPVRVQASTAMVAGFGEEWSATGMSAAGDPDRIEGFHAEGGVLVIVDEMKGVPQEAFDAIQGALTDADDARLLVTSVPGGAGSGPFWRACQDPERWRIHHVPAPDSSLVKEAWVADRARDWGLASPLYQTRVLGEFADAGEGVLFPLPLLEAAIERTVAGAEASGLGVDVARSIAGDLNAVGRLAAGRLDVVRTWRSQDTTETTARVLRLVAETGIATVAVDVGGPGGGVADQLKQLGRKVLPVHFGGGAEDPTRFRNRRAEMFWQLREGLERGTLALADDDEMRADLSALRYLFTPDGRIQVEGKDEVRRRLGRSPDRADALALALAASGKVRQPLLFLGPDDLPEPGEPDLAFDDDEVAQLPGHCWFPGDALPLGGLGPVERDRLSGDPLPRAPKPEPEPEPEEP